MRGLAPFSKLRSLREVDIHARCYFSVAPFSILPHAYAKDGGSEFEPSLVREGEKHLTHPRLASHS